MKKRKYQVGGEIDYNAVFQKAYDREQLEKQQKQQKIQSMFNMAGTAATFIPGGQLAAPFIPMLGNMVSQSFQDGGELQGRMLKLNGNIDSPLSSTAFEVNGYPNQTDGNKYTTNHGNVYLDNNEVVDGTYVFSDDLVDPVSGKKFSELAKKIQKSKGKAEKTLGMAPNDQQAMNTIKHLDTMSKSLQNFQESVATSMGLRDTTSNYQTGGETNPLLKLANAGLTVTKYFPITAPFARTTDAILDSYQTVQDIKKNDIDSPNSLSTMGNVLENVPARKLSTTLARKQAGKLLGVADDAVTVLEGLNVINPLYHNTDTTKGKPHYFEKFQTGGESDPTKVGDPNFLYEEYLKNKTVNFQQYNLANKEFNPNTLPPSAMPNSGYILPKAGGTGPVPASPINTPSVIELIKNAQNSAPKMYQSGGNIQQLGYKDSSPYNQLPFIDINSNNITMNGVSSPVMAYPNNDTPKLMMPGMDYTFPNSTSVREVKLQDGGDWITNFQKGYSLAFPNAKYKPTSKLDKKTKELLDSEYGKLFVKNNQLYYDKERGMLNPLKEVQGLAAQGLVRTPTNLEQLVSPATGQQVKMNVTEVPRLPLANPVIERSLDPSTYLDTTPISNTPSPISITPNTDIQAAQERLRRIDETFNNTSQDTNFGNFLKNNAGDIAQFAEVGSKFIDVFKKPEIESLRVDPTQITKQSFDPGAALYNSNRNYLNQVNSINTGSVNLDRALKTNAAVNRSNQDSRIISDYERMNNELNIDYEKRLQEKNRYNIQRSDYTSTINSQNRAARDAAMQNAFTSIGNLGEAFNNKKAQADIIEMYKKLFSTK